MLEFTDAVESEVLHLNFVVFLQQFKNDKIQYLKLMS